MNNDNTTIPVDDQFLQAMGLEGLEGEEKQKALDNILQTVNFRVAQRVADTLSEDQLDEFEKLNENSSQEEISKWLADNVTNYMQIIEEETQQLRDRAYETADRVMAKIKAKEGS